MWNVDEGTSEQRNEPSSGGAPATPSRFKLNLAQPASRSGATYTLLMQKERLLGSLGVETAGNPVYTVLGYLSSIAVAHSSCSTRTTNSTRPIGPNLSATAPATVPHGLNWIRNRTAKGAG